MTIEEAIGNETYVCGSENLGHTTGSQRSGPPSPGVFKTFPGGFCCFPEEPVVKIIGLYRGLDVFYEDLQSTMFLEEEV